MVASVFMFSSFVSLEFCDEVSSLHPSPDVLLLLEVALPREPEVELPEVLKMKAELQKNENDVVFTQN